MKNVPNHIIKDDNLTLFKWGYLHGIGKYERGQDYKHFFDFQFCSGTMLGVLAHFQFDTNYRGGFSLTKFNNFKPFKNGHLGTN